MYDIIAVISSRYSDSIVCSDSNHQHVTFFDSHCHFDFPVFNKRRAKVWDECRANNIKGLVMPGVSPEQWDVIQQLSVKYEGLSMAVGVHPWWIKTLSKKNQDYITKLYEFSSQASCVAIGECGLDKMIDVSFSDQQDIFENHLKVACDMNLPLILHSRKAHNEILTLLARYRPKAGGVIHGFSGSIELAERYWKLGFYIGIGGVITYPRANKTRQAIEQLPLDAIVLETDAPDMPLNGYQGQDNSPLKVIEVAHSLAELRGQTIDVVANKTTENSRRLFNL
ncbi:MAG: TatD family hydrolase [Cellvibrionaceae bacterium]